MWTSKKELAAALKLSVEAKSEKFLAVVELGPSCRGYEDGESESIEQISEKYERAQKWFGKGCMRTCCGSYQTYFYFNDDLPGRITVSYGYFKDAVKALDGREVELIIDNGALFLWQGKDYIRVPALSLGEEQKAEMPDFRLIKEQTLERYLNGYEVCGLADILKQIIGLTDKTLGNFANADLFYLENRVHGEFEDLVVAACGQRAVGLARQNVERLGGLGIMLFPSNVGRKIVSAVKMLSPSGVKLEMDNQTVVFDFGRFELRARLFSRDYVNPAVAVPGEVRAVFEFGRAQLLAFAKKSKVADDKIYFSYERGELKAAAGPFAFQVSGDLENGQRERPADDSFKFVLRTDVLLDVLRGAAADRISLMYAGADCPVYLRAGGVHYALVPAKKDKENGTAAE